MAFSERDLFALMSTDPIGDQRRALQGEETTRLNQETSRAGLDTTRLNQDRTRGLIVDEEAARVEHERRRAEDAKRAEKIAAGVPTDAGMPAPGAMRGPTAAPAPRADDPVTPIFVASQPPTAPAGDQPKLGAPQANNIVVTPGRMGTVAEAQAQATEIAEASKPQAGLKPRTSIRVHDGKIADLREWAAEQARRGEHAGAEATLAKIDTLRKEDDKREALAGAVKRLDDPTAVTQALGYLSSHPAIKIAPTGKNQFAMTVTTADGRHVMQTLGKAQLAELLYASDLMKTDPEAAGAIFASINKALGAAVTAENNTSLATVKGANDTVEATAKAVSANASATQAGLARKAAREVPPELLKQINELSVAISNEPDPGKRKVMEATYRRLNAQVATHMGKVVQPQGEAKPTAPPEGIVEGSDGKWYRPGNPKENEPRWVEEPKPGSSMQPTVDGADKRAAEKRAARQGPQPAKEPGLQRNPAPATPSAAPTGIEGLSEFALRRVAGEPGNPSAPAARAALEALGRARDAANAARLTDPAHDPAGYQR